MTAWKLRRPIWVSDPPHLGMSACKTLGRLLCRILLTFSYVVLVGIDGVHIHMDFWIYTFFNFLRGLYVYEAIWVVFKTILFVFNNTSFTILACWSLSIWTAELFLVRLCQTWLVVPCLAFCWLLYCHYWLMCSHLSLKLFNFIQNQINFVSILYFFSPFLLDLVSSFRVGNMIIHNSVGSFFEKTLLSQNNLHWILITSEGCNGFWVVFQRFSSFFKNIWSDLPENDFKMNCLLVKHGP